MVIVQPILGTVLFQNNMTDTRANLSAKNETLIPIHQDILKRHLCH